MEVRKPRGLWVKGASVLVAVGTLTTISLTTAGVASAQPPNQSVSGIKVSATIGGSDSDATPTIECSWALTDDNLAGGGETQQYSYAIGSDIGPSASPSYTNFTQPAQSPGAPASGSPNAPSYGGTPNSGQSFTYGNDDNPSDYLTAPNCTSTGAATSQPTQLSGSQASPISTGIQVLPNAFDSPAARRLEVWAAVDNATAVNFNVFYPNGTEDTDLGAVQIGGSTTACTSYGTSGSLLTNMFGAAGPAGASSDASNQISATAIHNATGTGIVDLCNDNEKSLWYQAFTVSKDDPNGTYTVEIQAVNSAGTSDSWISFYVIPFFDLAADFNSVTFTSSQTQPPTYFVSGDTTWAPPSSTFPTVTNGGNSGEEIGVDFSTLEYVPPVGSPYYISSFDANLGYNAATVLATDVPATAGTTAFISNNGSSPATGPQVVCPNDTPKLDLSLSPPSNAATGTYTGTLSVVGESDIQTSGGCTTDNGAPYVLPGPPKAFKTLTDLDPGTPVRAS
jgi:hypothetical protein